MKRLFCVLLAAALLLTGCGSRETAAEQEPLSVYMEAAPVMGRSYAPQSPLPREVTPMAEGGQLEALEDMDRVNIPHCTIEHLLSEIWGTPTPA